MATDISACSVVRVKGAGQGAGERAIVVVLPRQEGAGQRCLGNSPEPRRPSGSEVRGDGGAVAAVPGLSGACPPVQRYVVSKEQQLQCRGGGDEADIEGVEDVDDAERRGVEDADGVAGVDDAGDVAGVGDAGRDSGGGGRS